jgi:hypothetical protein
MTSRILHELTPDKMCQQLPLPVLEEISPRHLVCQVLETLSGWEQRERKLNQVIMISLLIAWSLMPPMALKRVWSQLTSALRWLSQQGPCQCLPTASALCYRRRTLGVEPLRLLMRLACQPLCEPSTPGAFCGWRVGSSPSIASSSMSVRRPRPIGPCGDAPRTTSHVARVPFHKCACSRHSQLVRMRTWGRSWLPGSARKCRWFLRGFATCPPPRWSCKTPAFVELGGESGSSKPVMTVSPACTPMTMPARGSASAMAAIWCRSSVRHPSALARALDATHHRISPR